MAKHGGLIPWLSPREHRRLLKAAQRADQGVSVLCVGGRPKRLPVMITHREDSDASDGREIG